MNCMECQYLQRIADVSATSLEWFKVDMEYRCSIKNKNKFRVNLEKSFDPSRTPDCDGRPLVAG